MAAVGYHARFKTHQSHKLRLTVNGPLVIGMVLGYYQGVSGQFASGSPVPSPGAMRNTNNKNLNVILKTITMSS
ncbi:hypothetical protein [Microbulbifer pacificus]|uniref:hypothetical protein n=1 Tax=Microbulbifer pacificus TaxID=407164 RepID=UPI00131A10CB|nr:hypothetical protein [Microbulbifer pacificus]